MAALKGHGMCSGSGQGDDGVKVVHVCEFRKDGIVLVVCYVW